MTISEFNQKTYNPTQREIEFGVQKKPRIVCNDGFSMSVQGSSSHYCYPRTLAKDYWEMEIDFPSEVEPLLLNWADESELPTDTVYGYVPVTVIDQVIEAHGGINEELTFNTATV